MRQPAELWSSGAGREKVRGRSGVQIDGCGASHGRGQGSRWTGKSAGTVYEAEESRLWRHTRVGGAAEMAADTTSASQASREGWYDTLVTHDLRWHNSKHAFDEPRSAVKPNPQPPRNSCRGVSVSLGAMPECRYLVVSIPSMLWPAQRHYSRWLQPLHRRHSYLTSSCESVVNHESRNHES